MEVRPGAFREPDLVLGSVSPDKPARDLVEKRHDHAAAGIPEDWSVAPRGETITVLRLDGDRYVERGVFGRGAQATAALLAGFAVVGDAGFDAE